MKKGLDHYNNLPYDVIVRQKGNRYIVFIPELSVVVEDANLSDAYEKLVKEKDQYLQKMIDEDYQDYIVEPQTKGVNHSASSGSQDSYGLSSFLLKFVIVFCTIALLLFAAMNFVPESLKAMSVLKEPTRLLTMFNNKMDNKPDDEKEEIINNLRHVIEHIKPFADELRVLFDNENAASLQEGKKTAGSN